ncbi:MAG: TlpA family protein disulfide reductase [Anaerolineales bacterium]|nr:TlpA family protein disulfide reductase [Anaerolineales bacterium]
MQKIDARAIMLIAGFALLGMAAALLLANANSPTAAEPAAGDAVLQQVPALSDVADSSVAVSGNGRLPQVGAAPADFTALDLAGNVVHLSDFRGQTVMINFWATWCPPCRRELPDFQAAYQAYQDDGLVILALNQDEPADLVQSYFYDENGFSFTPVMDVDSEISSAYGVHSFPTTVFVNEAGVVTAVHQGLLLPEQLDAYLAQTLPAAAQNS